MNSKQISLFIRRHSSRQGRYFTLIELLTVVGIIAVLAGLLFPVIARARETAMRTLCANNLRQLASACSLYRNDHKRFPESDGRFLEDFTLFYPYLRNLQVFVCPGNPYCASDVQTVSDLNGYTDYMYWPGYGWPDSEKNDNYENDYGNNITPSVVAVGVSKFDRVLASKITEGAIYDACGPAHCDSINIVYLNDAHVETQADMCNLWIVDADGELILDSTTPFPSRYENDENGDVYAGEGGAQERERRRERRRQRERQRQRERDREREGNGGGGNGGGGNGGGGNGGGGNGGGGNGGGGNGGGGNGGGGNGGGN